MDELEFLSDNIF